MKLILENRRKHLNEELLAEFDKTDKESLMEVQDRFTISYEIELESRDAVGDTPQGRREYASNYLTFDYFSENWNERETGDFFTHFLDEEDPEPLELVTKYLLEEYPTRAVGSNPADISAENLVRLSIAIKEDATVAKEFKSFYNNILREGTIENKALINAINNDPDIKDALKKRGVQFQTAQQGTLPLGGEAGEDTVILGMQPDVLKRVVHTHLFNPESDEFFPGAGTDQSINLTDFLFDAGWEEESTLWLDEADDQIKSFILDGGNTRYSTVSDLTYIDNRNWKSYHFRKMGNMVESAAQTWVEEASQSEWDEYQDDPEEYLDMLGFEWESNYQPEGEDGDFYEMMEEHFPRFMSKWADQLKFEPDGSLRNGIEFSMDDPKFMTGLDTAFEFLKDFFFEYNRQDNFQFDVNTGLHTNLGYLDDDGESHKEYNLMKALLFLNHDFAFKEFGQRKGTQWAGDLKSDIVEKIEKEFKQDRSRFKDLAMKLYKEDKLDELGRELSRFVDNYAPSNPKSLGFNIRYIDRLGYVEFRYPGGREPTLEKMKKATLYYAYVIKQAVDPTYKKKEYEQKLVKLMVNLASHVERPMEIKKVKAFMKKGEVYLFPFPGAGPRGRASLTYYMAQVRKNNVPYSLYDKDAGFFKGVRKGKSLKDTVAVFEVVTPATGDMYALASADQKDKEKPSNYKIGEYTIPLPQLERMITNGTLDFVGSNSTEERIRDVFKAVETGEPASQKKPDDTPPWESIDETNKLKGVQGVKNITIKIKDLSIGKGCPSATQDLKLNTKNRDAAIHAEHIQYGPLNVGEPGDYWTDIAEYWNTTEKAAQASLCGNCVAFDISPRMDDCMPGQTSDEDGRLGYCWMHHFKCHSARSCRTWAKGGPIEEDEVSEDWQERGEDSLDEGKICPKGKAWAMRKYGKWSAYAAMGASKYCKDPNYGKGKKKKSEARDLSVSRDTYGDEVVRKNKKSRMQALAHALKKEGELKKWRDEKWVQADGTPCGDAKKQKNPKRCKPKAKWATMSKGEKKADQAKKKRGGKKGKQFVSATKKGKVTKKFTKESSQMNKNEAMKIIIEKLERFINEEEGAANDSEIKKIVVSVLKKEGGAAGLGPIEKALKDKVADDFNLVAFLSKMSNVEKHEKGDYILTTGLNEETEMIEEAEYKGRKVQLNKRLPGDVKKFKAFVKGCGKDKDRVTKINFGSKEMRIKKNIPARRKSFRARHKCHTANDKCTARYWSCKAW